MAAVDPLKTISIFSSRPIISRKRWTEAIDPRRHRGAPFQEQVEQSASGLRLGPRPLHCGGTGRSREAELRSGVLDVPAQRLNVCISDSTSKVSSAVAGSGGCLLERRLHQRAKACIEIRRFNDARGERGCRPARTEGEVVHIAPTLSPRSANKIRADQRVVAGGAEGKKEGDGYSGGRFR